MGDDTLDPINEREAQLKNLLLEIITWSHRKPNNSYAYSRCKVCDIAWWDDKELHTNSCWVPRLKHIAREL